MRYRKQLAVRLGLTDVRDLRPRFADIAVHDPKADLWKTDTDACCNVRKVIPLDKALEGFDAWLTGRKRFHGGDRLRLSVVEEADHQMKFNPLANWGKEDLDAYVAEPLQRVGFRVGPGKASAAVTAVAAHRAAVVAAAPWRPEMPWNSSN